MSVSRTGGTGSVGGGGMVRPMYGVFIRDQVAQYRNMLSVTLKDLKAGIKTGQPNKQAVPRDGILQGSELTKAKKAAVAVDKAIKALKPVFGNNFGPVNTTAGGNALGRPGGGQMIAMYGVIMADDLTKYRTGIRKDLNAIQQAITNGSLKGDAAKEAAKAVKSLNSALKTLGSVTW
jgi:hypothetical protein